MKLAVEAVLKGMPLLKASIQFAVPRSTLGLKSRGWKGRKPTLDVTRAAGREPTLESKVEKHLAALLKTMSQWGFGLSKQDVLNAVQDYVVVNGVKNTFKNNRPGREWFRSFALRNKLSLKKPELLEGSRSRQSNDPFVVYDFYDQLTTVIKDLKLEKRPDCIYNCDESGFRSDPTTTKVVTARGLPAKRVTGGNARKTTTVLACVSADGNKLPPLILHKGKRLWNNMFGDAGYTGTSYAVSDNGWMTEDVFLNWFKNQFIIQVTERPVLLLYDGHLSHVGVSLIKLAIESGVTILKLPPHTSHMLQPLDVSVFKGVKQKWDAMLAEWARHNYGKSLPKSAFANILGQVWKGVKPEVIQKGFEKCGIYNADAAFPVNKSRIREESFDPEKLRRYKSFQLNKENSPTVPSPILEVEVETTIQEIEIPTAPKKPDSPPLQEKSVNVDVSFEAILLKTVSPVSTFKPESKRRRIDNAEIITHESYLKKLDEEKRKSASKPPPKTRVTKPKRKTEPKLAAKRGEKRCLF
jgi:hypothetical protein